jgi:hypothetical protein
MVPRTVRIVTVPALLGLFAVTSRSAAQLAGSGTSSVITSHESVRAAIAELRTRSELWRVALDSVTALGRTIIVVSPDQIIVRDSSSATRSESFDPSTIAEISPVIRDNGSIDAVLVVVNLRLIERVHRALGSSPSVLAADLQRILIHEIYGHAIPYLLTGHAGGRCADPVPGQGATQACSIRRENEVRKEAGLGERIDYSLAGLALGALR